MYLLVLEGELPRQQLLQNSGVFSILVNVRLSQSLAATNFGMCRVNSGAANDISMFNDICIHMLHVMDIFLKGLCLTQRLSCFNFSVYEFLVML